MKGEGDSVPLSVTEFALLEPKNFYSAVRMRACVRGCVCVCVAPVQPTRSYGATANRLEGDLSAGAKVGNDPRALK